MKINTSIQSFIISSFLLGIFSCGQARNGALIVADCDTIKMPTIDLSVTQVGEYDLKLSNQGNEELSVNDIKVSCDCVDAQPRQCVIPPKGKATIHIKISIGGSIPTTYEKTIGIYSNDSLHNPLVLPLVGKSDYLK